MLSLKQTYIIPQSARLAPFSEKIPVTSALDLLGLQPEKKKNMSEAFIASIKDPLSLKMVLTLWLNVLMRFMFLFSLIDRRKPFLELEWLGNQILGKLVLSLFQVKYLVILPPLIMEDSCFLSKIFTNIAIAKPISF